MTRTKDNHEIYVGMWIYDTTGIYEIRSINGAFVILREVLFVNDESGEYYYGDERRLLHSEIRHMLYE